MFLEGKPYADILANKDKSKKIWKFYFYQKCQLGVWFDETFSEYEYVAQCTCGETNYGFTSYFS